MESENDEIGDIDKQKSKEQQEPSPSNGAQPHQKSADSADQAHSQSDETPEVVRDLSWRIHLPWLRRHYAQTPVMAIFNFINGCISIGLMAVLALVIGSPFIFPSLGPTAYLFFSTPLSPDASPRNTLIGHSIGVLSGYFSLVVTGLTAAGPALVVGVTWPRVIASALSLGLTAGLTVLCKSPHPPAGATALIVSLGILTRPWQLLLLLGAVVLLTIQALALNRLAGIPYPLWTPKED